jgi:hypothetical protein
LKNNKPKSNNSTKKRSKASQKNSDSLRERACDLLWRKRRLPGKVFVVAVAVVIFFNAIAFGIGSWYQFKNRNEPVVIGTTFVPNYARYFELDPKETLQAMIDDLGIKRFRLVSYWKNHEKEPGVYDFSELDWQFDMIEKAGGEVSLAIGLRQPRWPECHGPEWAMAKPMTEWKEDLKVYMGKVIERYKDRPSLVEYQLENEFFLSVFGECPDFTRERLVEEAEYVRSKDPNTTLVISRSNNAVGFPIGEPQPDKFAVSVYKRVWDKTITKRYFEYPFPAWFYSFLAGGGEILTSKDLFIHELQTEAWLPQGMSMKTAPIEELYKSLNPDRLKDRLEYGYDTGMKTMDVWGVEWWYQMKVKRNAPEIWNTAKAEFSKYRKK